MFRPQSRRSRPGSTGRVVQPHTPPASPDGPGPSVPVLFRDWTPRPEPVDGLLNLDTHTAISAQLRKTLTDPVPPADDVAATHLSDRGWRPTRGGESAFTCQATSLRLSTPRYEPNGRAAHQERAVEEPTSRPSMRPQSQPWTPPPPPPLAPRPAGRQTPQRRRASRQPSHRPLSWLELPWAASLPQPSPATHQGASPRAPRVS